MIDIDEIHLWTIVGVSHGEGDERIHIGSARRDGAMIVLHEQNNGTDCCDGRVTVIKESINRDFVFRALSTRAMDEVALSDCVGAADCCHGLAPLILG